MGFKEERMQGHIVGDQSRTANYFLQGLEYYEENVLPKKQHLIKKLRKLRAKQKGQVQTEYHAYYVVTTKKNSLKWLKYQLSEFCKHKKIVVVVLEYFKDSSITSSYIKAYLERGNEGINIHQIICIEFQENDHIVQIDDEYNDTFSYMSLSRYYRKKLQHITMNRLLLMDEEVLEEYYASRYLV